MGSREQTTAGGVAVVPAARSKEVKKHTELSKGTSQAEPAPRRESCKNPESKYTEHSFAHFRSSFSQKCHECLGQLLTYP